jgi:hypothetical protein
MYDFQYKTNIKSILPVFCNMNDYHKGKIFNF